MNVQAPVMFSHQVGMANLIQQQNPNAYGFPQLPPFGFNGPQHFSSNSMSLAPTYGNMPPQPAPILNYPNQMASQWSQNTTLAPMPDHLPYRFMPSKQRSYTRSRSRSRASRSRSRTVTRSRSRSPHASSKRKLKAKSRRSRSRTRSRSRSINRYVKRVRNDRSPRREMSGNKKYRNDRDRDRDRDHHQHRHQQSKSYRDRYNSSPSRKHQHQNRSTTVHQRLPLDSLIDNRNRERSKRSRSRDRSTRDVDRNSSKKFLASYPPRGGDINIVEQSSDVNKIEVEVKTTSLKPVQKYAFFYVLFFV